MKKRKTSPLKRIGNLEAAFSVHEARLKKMTSRINRMGKRVREIEERNEGKSCIGFVHYTDEEE